MMRVPDGGDLVPVRWAHAYFKRSRATIYRWVKDGRVATEWVDDTLCVRVSELREVDKRLKAGRVPNTRRQHAAGSLDPSENGEIG